MFAAANMECPERSFLRPARWQTLRQTVVGRSFGDITDTVSVAPSSVTEALYNGLFCVFMTRVRYSLEK
jgi:hypothetical protein